MAKGQWVGVNGVARKVKTKYVGVSGVARKIKAGWALQGSISVVEFPIHLWRVKARHLKLQAKQ